MRELRGSFSIVVLSETEPGTPRRRQNRHPARPGLRRRREFRRLRHPRDSRAHPPRPRDGGRRAGRAHRRRHAPDDLRRRAHRTRPAPHRMGRRRRDQGRLSALSCARKSASSRRPGSIRSRDAPALGSPEVRFEADLLPPAGAAAISRIVMVSAGASWISSLIGKFMIEELMRHSCRSRLLRRIPLPQPRYRRSHYDDRRGFPVGRNRRHARRDGRRQAARMSFSWRSPIPSIHRLRARPTRTSIPDAVPKSASPRPNVFSRRSKPSTYSRFTSRRASAVSTSAMPRNYCARPSRFRNKSKRPLHRNGKSRKSRANMARRATFSTSAAASIIRSPSKARSSSRRFPISTPKVIPPAR